MTAFKVRLVCPQQSLVSLKLAKQNPSGLPSSLNRVLALAQDPAFEQPLDHVSNEVQVSRMPAQIDTVNPAAGLDMCQHPVDVSVCCRRVTGILGLGGQLCQRPRNHTVVSVRGSLIDSESGPGAIRLLDRSQPIAGSHGVFQSLRVSGLDVGANQSLQNLARI